MALNLVPITLIQKLTLANFTQLLKNLLPKGTLWKNLSATFSDFLESFAEELKRFDALSIDFLNEIVPGLSTSGEMLEDWERIALLDDEIPVDGTPESERQDIVQTKYYTVLPGPTETFFTEYAANLNITITSFGTVDRFRVGVGRIGDRLHGGLAVGFTWVVNYTGGTAAERAAMKAYFERLKPAHTTVDFNPAIP